MERARDKQLGIPLDSLIDAHLCTGQRGRRTLSVQPDPFHSVKMLPESAKGTPNKAITLGLLAYREVGD